MKEKLMGGIQRRKVRRKKMIKKGWRKERKQSWEMMQKVARAGGGKGGKGVRGKI